MLNRRILRVKAMQALYSYHLTRESLKDVVRDRMESHFDLDPAKDDFVDREKFALRRKKAGQLFNEGLKIGEVPDGIEDEEIAEEVGAALSEYRRELNKEKRNIRGAMMKDITGLKNLYLKLVLLAQEFSHVEKLEKGRKEKSHLNKKHDYHYHFINHPIADALSKMEDFNKLIIDEKINWEEHLDTLRGWYKDIIIKDEDIAAYTKIEHPTIEQHRDAMAKLFKKIIFKNDTIDDFLSEMDIRWSENKAILKSLVAKTFQDYEPELTPALELKEVIRNQEEDFPFFEELFDETLKNDLELGILISENIKNWDISRVALMDLIILKLAITEMKVFRSIPIKVTINEFIEISKLYSTPKSKQFVNGILDVLSNELTSKGVIKKSGRGLIDNK
ncbi:MAG: N utilization substance protein B [Cyclobacteriaceae bacterium]|jgi:N utilization substance protein B